MLRYLTLNFECFPNARPVLPLVSAVIVMLPAAISVAGCTSSGSISKSRESKSDYIAQNLENVLPYSITLGDAPPDMLSRYVVTYSFEYPSTSRSSEPVTFDHKGGVISGSLPKIEGEFPSTLHVDVSVDFQPMSQSSGLTYRYKKNITPPNGVSFFYEPVQSENLHMVYMHYPARSFWRRLFCSSEDYLTFTWTEQRQESVLRRVQTVTGSDLDDRPLLSVWTRFPPNPDRDSSYTLSVKGEYDGREILPFSASFPFWNRVLTLQIVEVSDGTLKVSDL